MLFTDIVDSTRSAATMGDQAWRKMLDSHDQLAIQTVERHRGIPPYPETQAYVQKIVKLYKKKIHPIPTKLE